MAVHEWIRSALPDCHLIGRPAAASAASPHISIVCYLSALTPMQTPRGIGRGPLHYDATFVVFADTDDPALTVRSLDALISEAASRGDISLVDPALPPHFWMSLGHPPRPALAVRAPARWDRPEAMAPSVREPLVVRSSTLTPST
jgi:hypothetical protein